MKNWKLELTTGERTLAVVKTQKRTFQRDAFTITICNRNAFTITICNRNNLMWHTKMCYAHNK